MERRIHPFWSLKAFLPLPIHLTLLIQSLDFNFHSSKIIKQQKTSTFSHFGFVAQSSDATCNIITMVCISREEVWIRFAQRSKLFLILINQGAPQNFKFKYLFSFPTKYQTKHPKESRWASSNSVPFVLLSNLSKYQKLKNMCTRVLLNTLLVYGRNNHWFFCGILYLTCYPALRCLNLKLNLCPATHFSYILHHLASGERPRARDCTLWFSTSLYYISLSLGFGNIEI